MKFSDRVRACARQIESPGGTVSRATRCDVMIEAILRTIDEDEESAAESHGLLLDGLAGEFASMGLVLKNALERIEALEGAIELKTHTPGGAG